MRRDLLRRAVVHGHGLGSFDIRRHPGVLVQRLKHHQLGDYTESLEAAVTLKARKQAGDQSQYSNWATIYCILGGWGFEITRRNAGMKSTHAEELCWRGIIDYVNETFKPKEELGIHATASQITKATGRLFEVEGIFSERQPCDECEKFLHQKFETKDIDSHHLVPYKTSKEKQDAANELAAQLELVFD